MSGRKKKTNLPIKDTLHKLIDELENHYQTEIESILEGNRELNQKLDTSTKQIQDQQTRIAQLEEERDGYIEQLAGFTESQTELTQRVKELEELGKLHQLEIQQKNGEWLELKQNYKKQLEQDTKSFKDVSILNKYLKEIDELKTENLVLHKRLDATKRQLVESKNVPVIPIKVIEEVVQEVPEEEAEEETEEEAEEEAEAEEAQAEEAEEAEAEEAEEVDPSTFDIIEIDDIEYYLDLDQQIRNKDTLKVVGSLTEEGDAIFNPVV